jgi:hypothetical protein
VKSSDTVRISVALTRDEAALLLRFLRRVDENEFEEMWDEADPARQRAREFMKIGEKVRVAIMKAGVEV